MFLFVVGAFLGCSHLVIPYIISAISNVISSESSLEMQLKNEIFDLKKQLQTVSMVDQFSAYAKLQRKINLLMMQYKDKVSERRAGNQKIQFFLKILLRSVLILCCLWIMWNRRTSAVISLSEDLLWPLGPILSFPSCKPGEISVMMWITLVNTSSQRLFRIFQSFRIGNVPSKMTFDLK